MYVFDYRDLTFFPQMNTGLEVSAHAEGPPERPLEDVRVGERGSEVLRRRAIHIE